MTTLIPGYRSVLPQKAAGGELLTLAPESSATGLVLMPLLGIQWTLTLGIASSAVVGVSILVRARGGGGARSVCACMSTWRRRTTARRRVNGVVGSARVPLCRPLAWLPLVATRADGRARAGARRAAWSTSSSSGRRRHPRPGLLSVLRRRFARVLNVLRAQRAQLHRPTPLGRRPGTVPLRWGHVASDTRARVSLRGARCVDPTGGSSALRVSSACSRAATGGMLAHA